MDHCVYTAKTMGQTGQWDTNLYTIDKYIYLLSQSLSQSVPSPVVV